MEGNTKEYELLKEQQIEDRLRFGLEVFEGLLTEFQKAGPLDDEPETDNPEEEEAREGLELWKAEQRFGFGKELLLNLCLAPGSESASDTPGSKYVTR
jgi:hypothetical protein